VLGSNQVAAAEIPVTQRHYLSGRGKEDAVRWKFMCTTGALSGFWTNLPVPSNWELHGFGHLNYKKDSTNALTERGLYEREFLAPKKWKGQRVFLVFEGAMTDTSAKLNGESVGPTHQGGFYRFKYEVTQLVKLGVTNKLQVEVAKHSANESVNRAERLADYWVFGGIYRPVYLEIVPPQFVERVAIDARADGTFAMDVFASGATEADSIEAQIATLAGKRVGQTFLSAGLGDFPVARSGNTGLEGPVNRQAGKPALQLTTRVASPKLWTAETPNLYRVIVQLKRGKKVLHEFTQRFGFRTFEVRDGDGLYLNGKKIILKGVNRHSFWPESGRCLSEAVHRLDIKTIKDMNGNAVRMSHYPPDVEFLDLCDELGLYILDELAGWHNHYDDQVGARLAEAMVTRDVNHPSILFWDNGNEGGFNTNIDHVFPKFDPQQRRVLHPWAPFSGINTAHYLAYTNAQIAASGAPMYYRMKENAELVNTNLPVGWIYLPTEFMHGLYDGGAGAGLEDYWNMMMSYSNCAGGFIWVFCDESVKRPDTGQLDSAGNQAPDGIVGPYREREASFYAIRDIWSPGPLVSLQRATDKGGPRMKSGAGRVEPQFDDYGAGNLWLKHGDTRVWMQPDRRGVREVNKGGQKYSLNFGPRLTLTNAEFTRLEWNFRTDGWLQCHYAFTARGTADVIGVVFDYPERYVKSKRWHGDGPFRVWKNRMRGVSLGVWENDYNDTITGYRDWKYPEFKGCFADVRWLQLETTEGLITVVPEGIPFVQVLTPRQPPDNLVGRTKVNLPECGLGFLHAIPPIGTKFKPAEQGGPQGQPNVATGEYSGTINFYFGKLR